jgi:phthalate 4,5-cis-dihydrodiol dehydrogenase
LILRVGIAGLGGAGSKILPSLAGIEGVELVAATDVRPEARDRFEATYGCRSYPTLSAMCASPDLNAVYIATPSHLHSKHTIEAVEAGKHVMCEKPIAVNLDDCDRMIEAARRSGVLLLQGHSKVMDSPVQAMRKVIASGDLGDVFQIDTWNFNDWMRRPRVASEVDNEAGGGVVMRQAPQQIDIVRYLIGEPARSVRAVSGRRAAGLPTEGHYTALISFSGGAAASLSFNGYGHFNISEFTTCAGAEPLVPRPLASGPVPTAEKYRALLADESVRQRQPLELPFCGLSLVSCERGVMRQSTDGIYVYKDGGRDLIPVTDEVGLAAGFVELRDALREGRPAFPDGVWGRATLEVCLAILKSSREGREVALEHQIGSLPT